MGGSSGGGGDGMPYYAQQDRLFGTQAQIAENMYNQYAQYAPNTLYDLGKMVDDINLGNYESRLYNQMRSEALANNASANAMERQATERQLASMGVNPNDPRFASSLRSTEINNAGRLSSQVNQAASTARNQADTQSWTRTADFYNMLAGMPTTSAGNAASAAAGYGNMGAQAANYDYQAAAGYGKFGQQAAQQLFADGGIVRGLHREPGFVAGGMISVNGAGRPMQWNPISGGSGINPNKGSGGNALAAFAAPIASKFISEALSPLAKSAASSLTSAFSSAAPAAAGSLGAGLSAAPAGIAGLSSGMTAAAPATGIGGATLSTGIGEGALGTGITTAAAPATGAASIGGGALGTGLTAEAAGIAGLGAGTTAAAGGATGAAAGAEAGSAAGPWGAIIGAGIGALLSGLELRDGGAVGLQRRNMTRGGDVNGPGTATSDSIPARLSDGEYVLNAEAVKLLGTDTLDRLNNLGLVRRNRNSKRG
jgi:hypothetical protein